MYDENIPLIKILVNKKNKGFLKFNSIVDDDHITLIGCNFYAVHKKIVYFSLAKSFFTLSLDTLIR